MRVIAEGVRTRTSRALLGWLAHVGPDPLSLLPRRALLPLRRDGLDPVEELELARLSCPVSRLPGLPGRKAWLITGYHETRTVLSDSTNFSNDFANLLKNPLFAMFRSPGGLGFTDPPEHTRLRRLLTPEFTRARLTALEPAIRRIVDEQLAVLARQGERADLWRDFALPVPTRTICELLGLPAQDWPDYQRLSTARFDLLGGAGASLGAISEALNRLMEVIRDQRRQPGPGLIGRIISRHGDDVGDEELAGLADGILTGGLESTASMLALGAIALLSNDDLADRLRRDPAGEERCVEELLRYLTVVQVAFLRFARRDVEVAGQRVAKGDVVICSLVSANRDGKLGADMDSLLPDRDPFSHVAFGYGAHRCIGAELARLELRVAYPALLRRFPAIRVAVPLDELRFRESSIVYGLDELPVRLD